MPKKLVLACFVTLYSFYYIRTLHEWHFIDNVNLIIHEAGHTIFFFAGQFIYFLAGSLFQVLIPTVFMLYFYAKREYFSSALLLFWVGQNILNVSVYASDAQDMQLPLLGGDNAIHDWNMILGMTHLLPHATFIGSTFYTIGIIVILSAIFFSVYTSSRVSIKN